MRAMGQDVEEVLLTEQQIQQRLDVLAGEHGNPREAGGMQVFFAREGEEIEL